MACGMESRNGAASRGFALVGWRRGQRWRSIARTESRSVSVELLFRRHVRIGLPVAKVLKKRAVLRLAGHDNRAVFATLQRRLQCVEFQPALLVEWTVAFHAIHVEKRLHLGSP